MKNFLDRFHALHDWIASTPASAITQVLCLKQKIFNGGTAVLWPVTTTFSFLKIRTSAYNDCNGSCFQHFTVWLCLHKRFFYFFFFCDKKFPRASVACTWSHHGSFQHLPDIFLRNHGAFFIFSDASSLTDHICTVHKIGPP